MRRILLIAADPGESALAAGRLGRAGHEVVVAPGGARALGLARAESFGLILVNAQLHGSDSVSAEVVRMCNDLANVNEEAQVVVFSPSDVPAQATRELYEVGVVAVICSSHRCALPALVGSLLNDQRDLIPAGQPHQPPSNGSRAARVPGTHLPQDSYSAGVAADPFQARDPWIIDQQAPISFDHYESKVIERAIASCGGDKIAAAGLLGVGKSTLYRKLKKLGIS